jgi:filamentous hemagglutinin
VTGAGVAAFAGLGAPAVFFGAALGGALAGATGGLFAQTPEQAGVMGAIDGLIGGAQPVVLAALTKALGKVQTGLRWLDPFQVRFSQTSAGGNGRFAALFESMMSFGWNGPAIDAVQTPAGIVSLDNTRLAIARILGIPQIPVRVRLPTDPLPQSQLGRFGGAQTWGDALLYRTGRQRPPLPPTGTPNPPQLPQYPPSPPQ